MFGEPDNRLLHDSGIMNNQMKTYNKSDQTFFIDPFGLEDSNSRVKFDLFVQLRKVKQITQALDRALLENQAQERLWLAQNQNLIDTFLSDLLDNSMLVLDGVQLDDESIDLSLDLMHDIRLTLDLMQKVIYEEESADN